MMIEVGQKMQKKNVSNKKINHLITWLLIEEKRLERKISGEFTTLYLTKK